MIEKKQGRPFFEMKKIVIWYSQNKILIEKLSGAQLSKINS